MSTSKIRDFFKVQGTKRSESKGKEKTLLNIEPMEEVKKSPINKKSPKPSPVRGVKKQPAESPVKNKKSVTPQKVKGANESNKIESSVKKQEQPKKV